MSTLTQWVNDVFFFYYYSPSSSSTPDQLGGNFFNVPSSLRIDGWMAWIGCTLRELRQGRKWSWSCLEFISQIQWRQRRLWRRNYISNAAMSSEGLGQKGMLILCLFRALIHHLLRVVGKYNYFQAWRSLNIYLSLERKINGKIHLWLFNLLPRIRVSVGGGNCIILLCSSSRISSCKMGSELQSMICIYIMLALSFLLSLFSSPLGPRNEGIELN